MAELRHGSAPGAAPPVVEANPDLQDALIEVANGVGLVDPDPLERLVLLEELLPVELGDAMKQGLRRGFVAASGATGRRFLRVDAHRGTARCAAVTPGSGGWRARSRPH